MLIEEKVREALKQVMVPGVKRSLVDMNLLRGVTITEEGTQITLASTGLVQAAPTGLKLKQETL